MESTLQKSYFYYFYDTTISTIKQKDLYNQIFA